MTMYDKIARMKPEQKNHWFDIPELSYWGERFFAEFAVAEAVALPEERVILEECIDELFDSFIHNHALTDEACQKAERKLLIFSERAKSYRFHHVAHAHIDMDWMWGFHETVDVVLGTFRTMLDLMDEYPEFTFSQSQCAVYRLTEFYDSVLFRRLKQRVKEGRFEFAGSTFVELDKNMPNLESMARHILYTKQYLNEKFGIPLEDVNMDFHPDSFGHSGSIPEIFRAGGIRYFYHCRGLDGEYLYRWRGNSGAEVLTLNEPLWYNDRIRPMYLSQVPKFCEKYGIHDMMKVYGVGDHGGGPTRQDIERIIDMQSWPVAPTILFSTYKQYFASITPYMENFPVVSGELGPTFTGCYTSQSKVKLANRVGEDRLFVAEALTAFAVAKTGMENFNPQFRSAWEKILFNQFHDILPGSNTPESRDHAMGAFEEAMGSVMAASGASLRAFADAIDTSMFETPFEPLESCSEGGGVGMNMDQRNRYKLSSVERGRGKNRILHFFNPTGFEREEVLEATLWDWPGNPEHIVAFDYLGNRLPCSATTTNQLSWGHIRTDVLVRAAVPALGYTTIYMTEEARKDFQFCALPPDPRVTYYPELILENELVRIEFDNSDFSVKRYINKKTGENLLSSFGGRFMLYREGTTPRGGCGWVEGVRMDSKDLHRVGRPVLKHHVQGNDLRREFQYEIQYGRSVIGVRAMLDAGSPVLELETNCRWLESADELGTPTLTFRAEMNWKPRQFFSDSQIGMETRHSETMHDCCGRNFFFADGDDNGFALLTDSKYGYRGTENALEVTLLRSSSRPDPYPELGERGFRIGLAVAEREPMKLKALGNQFVHHDLPYASNRAHKGNLPLSDRFFEVTGDAVVSAVKIPERGEGVIVRLAAVGEATTVSVKAAKLRGAVYTDLAEQDGAPLEIRDNTVMLKMEKLQVVTLRLQF